MGAAVTATPRGELTAAAMQTQQRPNVLITGVSTGIGFDATRYLIARGFHVFGSGANRSTPSV